MFAIFFEFAYWWEEPPACRSRLEAATTCMLFVLTIDAGVESFTSQMQSMTDLPTGQPQGNIFTLYRPLFNTPLKKYLILYIK